MSTALPIAHSVQVLRDGGILVFPTDTVWGVGVSIDNPKALRRLYSVKGRAFNKPTAVLVENLAMARRYGIFPPAAVKLAERYWPGALTLIVKARFESVPALIRGGSDRVGLRAPKFPLLLSILHELGSGIAAGSANFSGAATAQTFSMIDRRLINQADYVVIPASSKRAILEKHSEHSASTVVDTTARPFRILREGPISIPSELIA